ncbi:MAG: SURF1 family cytochrome oxidase biogenesis protein, partial [Nocardioidaceae bacterium]
EATNAQTRTNLAAAPAPVDDVLDRGRPVPARDEWRRVTATGTYDAASSVIVRYQTRDGASGVDVVTPLQTSPHAAVLVDRGWLRTTNTGAQPDAPPPPSGTVTVVGWVRSNAEGSATQVQQHSTRAVSSQSIAPLVPVPLYGGFVDAQAMTPKPPHPLVKAELPDLGNGPHFFYGIQWWFFGALAVFGFGYLAWDERRKRLYGDPDLQTDDRERESADAP